MSIFLGFLGIASLLTVSSATAITALEINQEVNPQIGLSNKTSKGEKELNFESGSQAVGDFWFVGENSKKASFQLLTWDEVKVNPSFYNKMNWRLTKLTFDITLKYSNNVSDNETTETVVNKNQLVTGPDQFNGTDIFTYEDGRHIKENGREADHLWKFYLETNDTGITINTEVWTKAYYHYSFSEASISFDHLTYHFQTYFS